MIGERLEAAMNARDIDAFGALRVEPVEQGRPHRAAVREMADG